jgi:hypothetical protein
MSAVHVDGVRALTAGERDLELRISGAGLQIYRLDTHQAVGTLPWTEVQTTSGRARFSLPGLRAGQVRDHLAPLLARHNVRVR